MIYIEESDLEIIFSIIDKFYSRREEVPNYRNDKHGLSQLIGVLERVKMDYYPLLEDKVSYLFIQVNKGHFFSNGNKRLALVLAVGFLLFNDKDINNYSIEQS
jgi:prophage maintenance system killer protein